MTGYLDRVEFTEGGEVKKGDLLYVIDPRPFQATCDRVTAQIGVAEANLVYRKAELARNKELVGPKVITLSEFDQSTAAHGEAVASVTATKADLETARLNLSFTEIRSPIDGKISKTKVTKGNLVNADQTLLTTIVSVDPMYVYFNADEHMLLRLLAEERQGKLKVDGHSTMEVYVGLANEEGFPHRGTIDFADNRVDSGTGTIEVRGVLPNPLPAKGSRVLLPGLFVRIRVPLGDPHKAVLVAEQALGTDQGQKYVLVVDDKNVVQYRRVKLGRLEAGLRVIEEGLRGGERVMVAGLQRVRPGSVVQPEQVKMDSFATPCARAGQQSLPSPARGRGAGGEGTLPELTHLLCSRR